MNTTKCIFFLITGLLFCSTVGQTQISDVDQYTGTNRITIPIWTCTAKGYSIPISLEYVASGIKVD